MKRYINVNRLSKAARKANGPTHEGWRPTCRSECANVPRPCPYVGCKYNLFLDVNESNGNIRLRWGHEDATKAPEEWSCVLDVVHDHPEGIAPPDMKLNQTTANTHIIINGALAKLREAAE